MECHRCPHAAAVAAGKYGDLTFEQTPCAACELVENSWMTREFDEERPGSPPLTRGQAGDAGPPAPPVTPASGDVAAQVAALRVVVTELLALPPAVRDAVCWRYAEMTYADIARVQGVTAARVEKRVRQAMDWWPALRGLFAEKVAKQRCRRPHRSGR